MSLVKFKQGTLSNYKKIASPDGDTLYFITDQKLLYLGAKLINATSITQKESGGEPVDGVYVITYIDSNNTVQQISVATLIKIEDLISDVIQKLDTPDDVPIASCDANNIVTITAGLQEIDGIISKTSDSDVTLGDAAMKTVWSTALSSENRTGFESSTNLPTASAISSYIDLRMSGVVGAMVYKGTIGAAADNPTITTLPAASSSNKGYVYVVKTAGTYNSTACEAGDMIISNGTTWDIINGENQVVNSVAEITPGASTASTIATIDGTDITLKVKTLDVQDATGTTGNVISGLSTTTVAGELTVTKTNVIASISGETAISGGNSNFVAVTATTASNATTLASSVKTQTISGATSSVNGLATAYDIKQNVADNAVLTGYSTATTGSISASSTITSAIKTIEEALTWGTLS